MNKLDVLRTDMMMRTYFHRNPGQGGLSELAYQYDGRGVDRPRGLYGSHAPTRSKTALMPCPTPIHMLTSP